MKQQSSFRHFCQEKWFEHKDEILEWTRSVPDYDSDYYFRKHRWMLKRMYLEQFANDNAREIQKRIKRSMKKGNI